MPGRRGRDRSGVARQTTADVLARRPAGVRLRRDRDAADVPDRYEIYTATLQKRLPKFKVPLAADDRDALLDLQAAFMRAFDLGNFGTQIDYKGSPHADVPLSDDNKKWLADLLKAQKLR